MAYKSFNQRFPKFKWVLLLAALIVIPLTVWSAQQTTSTEQHAAAATCGPSNTGPRCAAGSKCSYTQGNINFGGTCIPSSLSAPTGPVAYTTKCTRNGVSYGIFNFNWNTVSGADGYFLFYKYQGASVYSSKTLGKVTSYLLSLTGVNGRRLDWYLEAKTTSDTSPKSLTHLTPVAVTSCGL